MGYQQRWTLFVLCDGETRCASLYEVLLHVGVTLGVGTRQTPVCIVVARQGVNITVLFMMCYLFDTKGNGDESTSDMKCTNILKPFVLKRIHSLHYIAAATVS